MADALGGLVKCVVWDLDDTVWSGSVAYSDDVTVDRRAVDLVHRLEKAGVVQSVASKNDEEHALRALDRFGLTEMFVYPQISWGPKSASLRRIIDELKIGDDTVIFVDDSEYERAEVGDALPKVRCLSLSDLLALDQESSLFPAVTNPDAARRPAAYRAEARRRDSEREFVGTPVEFLSSLDMRLDVAPASALDVDRSAELTVRTNQLNTSGRVFSAAEIRDLIASDDYLVLVARLEDRFGDYGRIGLAIVRRQTECWIIELLLMSCRVSGRNVGTAFIGEISTMAAAAGVALRACYAPTSRNRQMLITYKLLGFETVNRATSERVMEYRRAAPIAAPGYIRISREGTISREA